MVLSTANLTKSLRDRSKPLLELLPTAQSVCRNEVSLFFPGKEEWLIEWLVERLDDEASSDGRLSPDTWNTLHILLNTPYLNLNAAAATLRKHKFIGIIAKTLSEAVARYRSDESGTGSSKTDTEDVEMQDAASSTSSSATEPGSPLLRTTHNHINRRQSRRNWVKRSQQVQILLSAVFRVMECLKGRLEGGARRDGGSPKRIKLDLTTPIFKFAPETAATLCEAYFELLYVVAQGLGWVDEAGTWTVLCQMIWKSCSYGVSDLVKLSNLVSEKILRPISIVLSLPHIPTNIRDTASWFLGEYIFRPVSGTKEKRAELLSSFKPLADAVSDQDLELSESAALSLPVILELAIEKADKDYSVKQRRHADGFVSVLLSWMLSATKAHLNIHTKMLDIAIQHKIIVEEAALKNSIKLALRELTAIDWAILQAVAKIDLDALLSTEGDMIFSLISQLDARQCDEAVWNFITEIVAVSVEARDLESLFERWSKLLAEDTGSRFTVWQSDRFQSLIASNVETGLTQNQIHNIFQKYSSPETIEVSLGIVDSIIRGISRLETIDKLEADKLIVPLFNTLTSDILKAKGSDPQWQCLRVILRLLDTWPSSDFSSSIKNLKATVTKRVNKLVSSHSNLKDGAAKDLSLLLTIALVLREQSNLDVDELENILKQFTPLISESHATSGQNTFDGSFDKLSDLHGVVLSLINTMTMRFMPIISELDASILQDLVLQFAKSATRKDASSNTANLRSAWSSFVQTDSKVYDDIKFKDSLFHTLLAISRTENDAKQYLPLILETLTKCPLAALRKSQREAFIDTLLPIAEKETSREENKEILEVLVRLARLSTNSSALATSIGDQDGLYGLFTKSGMNLEVKIELVASVVKHLVESRHHEKPETQLFAAVDLAEKLLEQSGGSRIAARAWSYAIIQGITTIIEIDKEETITTKAQALLQKLFTIVVSTITESEINVNPDSDSQYADLDLKFIEFLVPLAKKSGGSSQSYGLSTDKAMGLRHKFDSILLDPKPSMPSRLLVYYGRIASAVADDSGKQATEIAFLLGQKELYESFRTSYRAALSRLDMTALYDLLGNATDIIFPASNQLPSSFYAILRDILSVIMVNKTMESQSEPQTAFVFSQLALAMTVCNNFESIRLLLDTALLLLKDKAISISQLNIEEILATIAAITSSHGPQFQYSNTQIDSIFIPICSIVGNILSGQRFRIKNRHGLIVTALNSLMSLLFVPRSTGRKKSDTEIHPPWLANLKSWTVSKEAAVAYCRLLTMLCNPSTSSVRTSRKSDSLSSATVAARKAVEPHIPVLLKRYINLNLTHHLTSDVRAALTPGLYAMFDVMQESTMRSLNMSLDNPGRVLFKALYEDWNKFGKWVD